MTTRQSGRPGSDLPAVFLYPATMFCTAAPTVVTTVLGSCVAVSLTDRRRGVSGLNHYLLPNAERGVPSLRHGETAIPLLFEEMLRHGCRPEDIEAKIFGGAAVLPVGNPEDAVGSRNITVALDTLHALGIEVVARRTGGKTGMLMRLFTATGEVLMRKVAGPTDWTSRTRALNQRGRLARSG